MITVTSARLQTLKAEVQQTTYRITSQTKEELDQDQIKFQANQLSEVRRSTKRRWRKIKWS
jgi:hypothetical protein